MADNHGAVTQHAFMIFFTSPSQNKTVPNLVGQPATAAPGLLAAVDLQVGVVTHVDNSAPAGQVLSQNPVSGTSVLKRSTVDFVVSNGPAVPPSGAASPAREPREDRRRAGIGPEGHGRNGSPSRRSGRTTTGPAPTSPRPSPGPPRRRRSQRSTRPGSAHAAAAGTTAVTATANGLTASATLTVASRTPGDIVPPTALITAAGGRRDRHRADPDHRDGQRRQLPALRTRGRTGRRDVVDRDRRGHDGGDRRHAGHVRSDDAAQRFIHAAFDGVRPQRQRDGSATITVQVTRRAESPDSSRSTYQDLNLPAAGIPVTVTRTYDSRDKAKGDFGIGWRLGVQTLRLRTNRVPGTGWVRNISGAIVGLVPTSEHKVSLTLPDGKVEEFDLILSPTSGFGGLDATAVTGYAPRPGTLGKLEMLDNPYLLILNAGPEDELVDDTTLNTFEPLHYRYTTLDGTQIEIHRTQGVKKVTDTNGNTVTFGPAGIIHSSGRSVVFARDGQGRITQITDPLGNVQTYAYDGNGDLVSHATATGDVSHYGYDYYHGLIDIQDPAGNHAARNEYDDAGRLIATTDAKGNQITFTHDTAASRDIVRDRLGNPTLYDYDAAGNITTKTRRPRSGDDIHL